MNWHGSYRGRLQEKIDSIEPGRAVTWAGLSLTVVLLLTIVEQVVTLVSRLVPYIEWVGSIVAALVRLLA